MSFLITAIKMIGGLVLLIYGMNILSTNLKKIAGEKLKLVLKKATDNIFKGLFTGILITIAVQSSAIVTVMVVGFVNAKLLKLKNAIPIIMGANIGTTITAQILRLASINGNSIFTLLSPNTLAPILIIVGFILLEFRKKQKIKDIGQLLIGIGLLFTGLMTMVDMASSFSKVPLLADVLSKLSNPLLGILAGAIVTAIVQSSAATVGILQAISQSGIITYKSTIPIILGQNIGTCFTSILSSIGTNKNAKRVAIVHLFFNLIGSIIFIIFIYTYQSVIGFSFWNKTIDMGGIANFHLIFNVVCTILLLPCIGLLEKLAMLAIKDSPKDEEDNNDHLEILNLLGERINNISNVAISNSVLVITKMAELTKKNLTNSFELLDKFKIEKFEKIKDREEIINKIDVEVANFLVKLDNLELTEQENEYVTSLLKIELEFEKIGDYIYEATQLIQILNNEDIKLSEDAKNELKLIYNIVDDALNKTLYSLNHGNINNVIDVQVLKQLSEMYSEKFKKQHIERLKNSKCSIEAGVNFIEILTSYNRIIDNCINIILEITNYKIDDEYISKHEYFNILYKQKGKVIKKKYNDLVSKYDKLLLN